MIGFATSFKNKMHDFLCYSKRFYNLDASRGLAALGVVLYHCDFQRFFYWYWGAMDFFFVLSGFLITKSLVGMRSSGKGFIDFMIYRAFRLMPVFLFVIFLYEIIVLFVGYRESFQAIPYLLFYQNTDLIFSGSELFPRVPEMRHFWSLILEEHFYFFWGIVWFVFIHKLRITSLVFSVFVVFFFIALALRIAGVSLWTLPGRFDGFLMGSLLGIFCFSSESVDISIAQKKWLGRVLIFSLGIAFLRITYGIYISYVDYDTYISGVSFPLDVTSYNLVSAFFIFHMYRLDLAGVRIFSKPLIFVGMVSYELYVVHFPVIESLRRIHEPITMTEDIIMFLVILSLSMVAATFMHLYLTRPALKYRDDLLVVLRRK